MAKPGPKPGPKRGAILTSTDVVKVARQRTTEALDLLYKAMNDPDCPWNVRVKAAVHLIERGHGKVPNVLHVTKDMTPEELEAQAAKILQRRGVVDVWGLEKAERKAIEAHEDREAQREGSRRRSRKSRAGKGIE